MVVSVLTSPQSSWSSPDPWTYAKPADLLSTPSSICLDADTQTIGRKEASPEDDGKRGKLDIAGVTQIGRRGCLRSGIEYEDP